MPQKISRGAVKPKMPVTKKVASAGRAGAGTRGTRTLTIGQSRQRALVQSAQVGVGRASAPARGAGGRGGGAKAAVGKGGTRQSG